jgi:hypothetical protein
VPDYIGRTHAVQGGLAGLYPVIDRSAPLRKLLPGRG